MRSRTGNGHSVNVEKFLDDIKAVVQDGEQLLKAGVKEIKGKAIAGAKTTDQLVRSKPYQTLGIMLGVGLLVGLIAAGAFSGKAEAEEELEEEEV
jgi:ElaB/YqjD/DUF883 family membrane-anchored ribosome-binding protein